eukprot:2976629-Prymnesium_polylepis.1
MSLPCGAWGSLSVESITQCLLGVLSTVTKRETRYTPRSAFSRLSRGPPMVVLKRAVASSSFAG